MKRRDLLIHTGQLLSLTTLSPLMFLSKGYACEYATPHLDGFLPENSNKSISGPGQFHHYHYLHVPESILNNPPEEGWTTISSMMVPSLGIGRFFFRERELVKQYHCHQVWISNSQLTRIAAGLETEVFAYIQGRQGGRPRQNHSFIFNRNNLSPNESFSLQENEVLEIAQNTRERGVDPLLTERVNTCFPIRVFNSKGFRAIENRNELMQLRGY